MTDAPPIRVMQVLIRLSPTGGVQIVLRRLADHLDPSEVELHVTTIRPLFREDQLDDVPAHLYGLGYTRRGYRPIDRVRIAVAVARRVRHVRPDIVQLHSGTAWYGLLARLLNRRPTFMIEVHDAPGSGRHSDGSDRFEGWWIRRLGATAICHSSSVEHDLATAWSLPADRIEKFPLCVDVDTFTPRRDDTELARWRAANDIGEDDFLVMAVGRSVPTKRYDLAIEVLRRLVDAGVPARLMLIGRGSQAEDLRALADRTGVGAHVTIRGDLVSPELPEAMRSADVLISTSEYEGFGLTVVEAMGCGVPVVAMAVGGLTDLIDPGVTGHLVPPGDVDAMTERLLELSADADLRRRMGTAGRERAVDRFSADRMARSFTEAYRRHAPGGARR